LVVEEERVDRHVVREEELVFPENAFGDGDLLEVGVLKDVLPGVFVRETQRLLNELRLVKLVVRAETAAHGRPREHVLELAVVNRLALARLAEVEVGDQVRLSVV